MERYPNGTIGQLLAAGDRIAAYCENPDCKPRHSARLDLATLGEILGMAFDVYAGREILLRRLRCRQCGARRPSFIFSPGEAARYSPTHSHGSTYR